jgi:hypothetical protein
MEFVRFKRSFVKSRYNQQMEKLESNIESFYYVLQECRAN